MDDDGVAKLDNDPCDEDKYPNFLDLSLAATNNIRANKEKEVGLQSNLAFKYKTPFLDFEIIALYIIKRNLTENFF